MNLRTLKRSRNMDGQTLIVAPDGQRVIVEELEMTMSDEQAAAHEGAAGEVHIDHPLRHYDRTCPSCNQGNASQSEKSEVAGLVKNTCPACANE